MSIKLENNVYKDMPLLAGQGTQRQDCSNVPVGTEAGTTVPQGNMAEQVYQSLNTHAPSGPVLPLSVLLPK